MSSLLKAGGLQAQGKSKFGRRITGDEVSDSLFDVSGFLLPAKPQQKKEEEKSPLVPTETSQRNLSALALAVCRGNPVLLEGVTGAGKTKLIQHLSSLTGKIIFSISLLSNISF